MTPETRSRGSEAAPRLPGRLVATTPLRILCADDDPTARRVVEMALVSRGHTVLGAADGRTAWVELAARPDFYDIVITDHDMPHLTGLDLAGRLRRAGFAGRIVVISGSVDARLAAEYRALRVDSVLTKPVALEELLDAVQIPRSE